MSRILLYFSLEYVNISFVLRFTPPTHLLLYTRSPHSPTAQIELDMTWGGETFCPTFFHILCLKRITNIGRYPVPQPPAAADYCWQISSVYHQILCMQFNCTTIHTSRKDWFLQCSLWNVLTCLSDTLGGAMQIQIRNSQHLKIKI